MSNYIDWSEIIKKGKQQKRYDFYFFLFFLISLGLIVIALMAILTPKVSAMPLQRKNFDKKQVSVEIIERDFCTLEDVLCDNEQYAEVSAYTPRIQETDDTPNIMASGQTVRDGVVANNCLPFGTKVKIDGKVYEVQDRMNRRYDCNVYDLFMFNYQDAINFGRKKMIVEIL